MLNYVDQEQLFRFIAEKLNAEIIVYAFGGTAMMYYGYKEETKDVDILFEKEEERKVFIEALKLLNFTETSPMQIYIPEKLRDKYRPLMFKRDTYRFDLFVKKIFRTILSERMKEDVFGEYEYHGKKGILKVRALRKEILVLLKAVTERSRDFEDIVKIVKREKNFDWEYFTNEVLWQAAHGDSWVLLDSEKMLLELRNYVFLEEKWLKKLYASEHFKRKK
jgi:hypothetical protein